MERKIYAVHDRDLSQFLTDLKLRARGSKQECTSDSAHLDAVYMRLSRRRFLHMRTFGKGAMAMKPVWRNALTGIKASKV